jgi:hypothetical protein
MPRSRRANPILTVVAITAAGCGGRAGGPAAPEHVGAVFARVLDQDHDGILDEIEDELAAQYRPYWFVDGSETIRAISVEDLARLGGANVDRGDTIRYADLPSLLEAVRARPRGILHLPAAVVPGRPGGAPVYVEIVPMAPLVAVAGRAPLVWLHYWLLFGDDVKPFAQGARHRGDWEHVCVLAERDAVGDRGRPPVMIHWHHHASADVAATAHAWHADARGAWHPRVYVEAGDHAMYRLPGIGLGEHDDGAGSADDPLDDPIVFLGPHRRQTGAAALEAAVVRIFDGRWGQTIEGSGLSPRGPLAYNTSCDRDYRARPGPGDFALGGCDGL